jgi:hypothetical protein
MKLKTILIFIVLIILIGIVFLSLGIYNKPIGFNPIFSYEDKELLEKMSLRELLEYKSDIMTRLIPLDIIKIALPLRININLYDNEDFTTIISKEGQVVVFDKIENTDVIIHGNEQELKELFLIETNDQLLNKIEETNFEAVTFKGKLTMQIMEDYLGVKVVNNKSVSQKVMGVVTKPTVSIFKMFS